MSELQQAAQSKHIYDARKKFAAVLEDEVLDYKHHHPVNIENCLTVMRRIFTNVLEQPLEGKFRQVKATSNAFKKITDQKGGEHLVMLAGWRAKVEEYQKYWTFDGEVDSTKFKILQEAVGVLDKAMQTVHDKAERKRKEQDERKQKMTDERERIRLQIEDDKGQRKLRNEVMAHHDAVPAEDLCDPPPQSSPPAAPRRTAGPGEPHPLLQPAKSLHEQALFAAEEMPQNNDS